MLKYEEHQLTLLHISTREDPDVINLLLIAHEENQYYTLVKDFSRFLGEHPDAQHVFVAFIPTGFPIQIYWKNIQNCVRSRLFKSF